MNQSSQTKNFSQDNQKIANEHHKFLDLINKVSIAITDNVSQKFISSV